MSPEEAEKLMDLVAAVMSPLEDLQNALVNIALDLQSGRVCGAAAQYPDGTTMCEEPPGHTGNHKGTDSSGMRARVWGPIQ